MESRITAGGWGVGDEGVGRLSKKEKGLRDMDNGVVIVGGGGGIKGTKWSWKKV